MSWQLAPGEVQASEDYTFHVCAWRRDECSVCVWHAEHGDNPELLAYLRGQR